MELIRNPSKRIDRGCSNVDKCLNRRCGPDTKAKKARTEPKPEHVLRSEAEHRALREKMKSMPEAERQNWYKEQKKQQGEEDAMSKRRLTDTSASINQLNEKPLSKAEQDRFECFDDWAPRQMIMGRCKTEADCIALFKKECSEPGAVTMEHRGQVLLSRFIAVAVDSTSKQGLLSQTLQTMSIQSGEDMSAFEGVANSAINKFARSLAKDHQSTLPTTIKTSGADADCLVDHEAVGGAANIMKTLVQKDLEKKYLKEVAETNHFLVEAAEAYKRALDLNPTLWVAYERLCRLG